MVVFSEKNNAGTHYYIYLKGRSDDMVISGAENIDQKELIDALSMIEKFDKIILSHGKLIIKNAKEVFNNAFKSF